MTDNEREIYEKWHMLPSEVALIKQGDFEMAKQFVLRNYEWLQKMAYSVGWKIGISTADELNDFAVGALVDLVADAKYLSFAYHFTLVQHIRDFFRWSRYGGYSWRKENGLPVWTYPEREEYLEDVALKNDDGEAQIDALLGCEESAEEEYINTHECITYDERIDALCFACSPFLSPRETDALRLLLDGHSMKSIQNEFGVSRDTCRSMKNKLILNYKVVVEALKSMNVDVTYMVKDLVPPDYENKLDRREKDLAKNRERAKKQRKRKKGIDKTAMV